jgi:predicted ATPase
MQYRILGPMEVLADGGSRLEIGGGRERALLGILIVRAGRVVGADRLIDEVWGEDLPANPANALQVRISRLRKVVGESLVTRAPGYLLDLDGDVLDARDFEAMVDRARTEHPADARRTLEQALELVRGDPFADVTHDGLIGAEAARLTELHLKAIESYLAVRVELGESRDVIPELEALVEAHPLRESIRASLMLALYRTGRQADALRVYGSGRRLLAEELGIEPGTDLQELEERILMQDPRLAGSPDPDGRGQRVAADQHAARRRLPTRLTSFIGRATELSRLVDNVGSHRLVTVIGPPGAGKTSLALEGAASMPDDVDTMLVELAAVRDPSFVAAQIAASLGLEAGRYGDPAERLIMSFLGDRTAVLVLDNCEHVLDGVAPLVDEILTSCQGLTIVATSRERLGVPGERVLSLGGLEAHDAVRLFIERASHLGTEIDPADPTVGVICRRLDHLPLAVELGAALTTSLEPAAIAERLDDRLSLLTGGARTALPRHQTLRAAVAWSYDLLDLDQAALFRSLGLVRSSWEVSLAASLAGIGESAAIVLIGALVDRSMVERLGDGRFRMLDTLRAYACEQLEEAGEAAAAVDRFIAHVEELAAGSERDMRTARQLVWIERLAPERDHLRHAVELALEAGDVDRALHLCGMLSYFWFCQALVNEELALVQRALAAGGSMLARARAGQALLMLSFIQAVGRSEQLLVVADEMVAAEKELGGPPHSVWAEALAGVAHALGGDPAVGIAALNEALAAAIDAGDEWTEGLVRSFAAAAQAYQPNTQMRPEPLEPALACFRRCGDRWMLAFTLSMQATIHRQLGEYSTALVLLEEAHALSKEVRSRWIEANSLIEMGNLSSLMGEHDAAIARHLEAEPLAADVGAPGLIGHVANSQGLEARARGDVEAALAHHARAMRIYRTAGGQGGEALALDGSGYALQELGRIDEARELHRQAFELGLAGRDLLAMALSVEALAGVAVAQGDPTRAALLLGAGERLRASLGVPLAGSERFSVDRSELALRNALGDGGFSETVARGRMLTDEDLILLVRSD